MEDATSAFWAWVPRGRASLVGVDAGVKQEEPSAAAAVLAVAVGHTAVLVAATAMGVVQAVSAAGQQ